MSKTKRGFLLTGAADLDALHPMSDLAEVNAILDELEANQANPPAQNTFSARQTDAIWANYNRRKAPGAK